MYDLYVLWMPVLRSVFAFHPSEWILVTSSSFLGVPSGFERSLTISPLNPTISLISSARSFDCNVRSGADIDEFADLPGIEYFSIRNRQASARSSTYRNSLKGSPEPQRVTDDCPDAFASWNFRIRAGSTWEIFRSKLSFGAVQVRGHDGDEVRPILLVVIPAQLDRRYFGDGIGFVGRFQKSGQKMLFLHGLRREFRIDAGGAEIQELFDACTGTRHG